MLKYGLVRRSTSACLRGVRSCVVVVPKKDGTRHMIVHRHAAGAERGHGMSPGGFWQQSIIKEEGQQSLHGVQ